MKHIFVVNPCAGKGNNKAVNIIKPLIEKFFADYNEYYEIHETTAPYEGIDFVKTRSNAIKMTEVSDITVNDCEFKNIGYNGIKITSTKQAETDKHWWQRQQVVISDKIYMDELISSKIPTMEEIDQATKFLQNQEDEMKKLIK